MIAIEIGAQGVGRAAMIIEAARAAMDAAGNKIKGVDLHAKQRVKDDADSVLIARELIAHGRDFFGLNQTDADAVALAFTNEMQRMLDHLSALPADVGVKLPPAAKAANHATQAVSKGYREAMFKYMDICLDKIKSQTTLSGKPPDALSPEYAAYKMREFGFTSPIGVATGQLIENFDKSNKSNVRAHRGILK